MKYFKFKIWHVTDYDHRTETDAITEAEDKQKAELILKYELPKILQFICEEIPEFEYRSLERKNYMRSVPVMLKRGKDMQEEPEIIINGTTLSGAQAMTVRVALNSYLMGRQDEGLGDDEHGKKMTKAYIDRGREVLKIMMD